MHNDAVFDLTGKVAVVTGTSRGLGHQKPFHNLKETAL